jgi:hypothetical protein
VWLLWVGLLLLRVLLVGCLLGVRRGRGEVDEMKRNGKMRCGWM